MNVYILTHSLLVSEQGRRGRYTDCYRWMFDQDSVGKPSTSEGFADFAMLSDASEDLSYRGHSDFLQTPQVNAAPSVNIRKFLLWWHS